MIYQCAAWHGKRGVGAAQAGHALSVNPRSERFVEPAR